MGSKAGVSGQKESSMKTFLLMLLISVAFSSSSAKGESAKKMNPMVNDGISATIKTAMVQLNRYCGSGSYSYYRPTYYRPSGPSLSSLISPVVFGLATGAGLGLVGNLIGK